ncbi:MAG: serine/threonine protein kinase [Myxococcaceae bacterium]|nr:serine/threonine protein kinase [Myxococcaceae bacterium]
MGRYAIDAPFAAGGMATVHLGRTKGPMGFSRTVAVKRLLPALAADPGFTARFVDEARLASRVRHVNVVPTLDVVAEDGELLIVMEYVAGLSLARTLAEPGIGFGGEGSSLPLPVVTAIVIDVLEGLHAAHSATTESGQKLALVHRDVSPQNVLVGIDGIARVIDFGIATAAERLHLTDDNNVRGKVGYVAPEVFLGDPATFAVDLYGAGVMLWELLAHRRLMTGLSKDFIERVVLGDHDGPRKYRADVPIALETVVMKALSPAPAQRFADAHAMAIAVQAACPRANSLEVAAWLKSVAAAPLAQHAADLARFESTPAERLSHVQPSAIGVVSYDPTVTITELVSDELVAPRTAQPPIAARRPRRRALVLALIASLAATVLVVLAFARHVPDRAAVAPAASTMAVAADPPHAQPAVIDTAEPPPIATARVTSTHRSASKPIPPAHVAASAVAADCKVPFYFDADGVKRYRPECMK